MQNYILIVFIGLALSLGLTLLIMPHYIKLLKALHYEQRVSEYALEEYKNKAQTPIMGGALFVVIPVIVFGVINLSHLLDPDIIMIIMAYVLFFIIGFLDDILIIIRQNNEGLSPKLKMAMEVLCAVLLGFFFLKDTSTFVTIPFTNIDINLPHILYVLLVIFMYCAESNAVNFTDGMDGLCAGVSFIAFLPFLVLAFKEGEYDIALFIILVLAALIGYLRFNFFPAKIFMGDSGSLALGALFVAIAVALKAELWLLIGGGVFLWEMVCCVLQQIAVRTMHRRIFKYTPIHYAFVIRGLREKKVVILFYMIQGILSLIMLIGVLL